MAGKGMAPKKGYNQKLYSDNYDKINWKNENKKTDTKSRKKSKS